MSFQQKTSPLPVGGWCIFISLAVWRGGPTFFFSGISHWVKIQLHHHPWNKMTAVPNLVKLRVSIIFLGHIFLSWLSCCCDLQFFHDFSPALFFCFTNLKGFDVLLIPRHPFSIYHPSTHPSSHTTIHTPPHPSILLMVQKSCTTWNVQNLQNNRINYQPSTGEFVGFLNHQQQPPVHHQTKLTRSPFWNIWHRDNGRVSNGVLVDPEYSNYWAWPDGHPSISFGPHGMGMDASRSWTRPGGLKGINFGKQKTPVN